ncbi:urate hydroxylase PuuD [Enterovibrio makurazakiensis]|uniref:Urate hydroxylase PuuD n=1 Tax=Enterovibrio gelatinilyticus TaxID=2899819 RepID=A0ABT5QWI2_9GAMM|nr:urate hydroxylase PuuD [Enterovibrio sp. ZSDZ42]MDD1792300.1 urate hydroxylase PuuD [Enterovibrio sp. ZSDZ42]
MDPYITEWLNLAVRWMHMITGVAWIGASFYFVWLENNLNRQNPRDGLSGDLWAIHGGGIYHLEKYKLAPEKMPETLHWFKWEAYFTWITGMTLLFIVFYANADIYLVKPGSEFGASTTVMIGIASLVAGWFIYDLLCDSPLGKKPMLLGMALFAGLVFAAWALSLVFSGRGAYIHVGAIIGTIMVGNVFRVIMPGQRALVKAIEENREPDASLPAKALLRSRHNNYLTLPVLFIMISNHFPSTYGHEFNWAVLAGVSLLSVLVRHYFNTRHGSQKYAWTLPAAALGMICLAYVSAPSNSTPSADLHAHTESMPADPATLSPTMQVFVQVDTIIKARCTACHSQSPSHPAFAVAPAGVMLDTPEQIQREAMRIVAQSVDTTIMPLGNLTQMTQEERDVLGQWAKAGAAIQ